MIKLVIVYMISWTILIYIAFSGIFINYPVPIIFLAIILAVINIVTFLRLIEVDK